MSAEVLPEFRPWSVAAVRLLQGVVYADDARIWNLVLTQQTPLATYFGRIGLLLVVDEPEGLAYLRQLADGEIPPEYEGLPKLFRKSRLGYDPTLLCVLLREELRRYEEEDVHNERCVVGRRRRHCSGLPPSRHRAALDRNADDRPRPLLYFEAVHPLHAGSDSAFGGRRPRRSRIESAVPTQA